MPLDLTSLLSDPNNAFAMGLLQPNQGGTFGGALQSGMQGFQGAQQANQAKTLADLQAQQAKLAIAGAQQKSKDTGAADKVFSDFRLSALAPDSPGGKEVTQAELQRLSTSLLSNRQTATQGISLLNATGGDALATQVVTRVVGSKPHSILINKTTGEDIKDLGVSGAPVGEKGSKTFEREDTLRDEHTKLSGEFIKVRDSFNRIQVSATDPSAAGDLSMVFNYMKMLDPGSVVRESEFATAQNSAGVPDKIRAKYNNILSGERLAPDTRADFVNRAGKLFGEQQRSQRSLDKRYTGLAERNELNPANIVLDFDTTNRFRSMTPAELQSIDINSLNEKDLTQFLEITGG